MTEKRNAPARMIPDGVPAGPGEVLWERAGDVITGMMFGCPCGCTSTYAARWSGTGGWSWNGSEEKPTVTPSLGCYPSGPQSPVGPDGTYHWHGYLTDGRFEEC